MSRPLKYGEPMIGMYIRVPQSRKDEIKELVRERLNGNDGWISVEDKLPPSSVEVLIKIHNSNTPLQAFYNQSTRIWRGSADVRDWMVDGSVYDSMIDDEVTHWMPLPPTP